MSTLHTISVLVEDRPGVLTRVAGLFAARGYNIDSLAVGPTDAEGISRMTIVVNVDESPLEQVTKQLNKLVNVIKILEHDPGTAVERELMLVKVHAQGDARARIMEIAEVFRVNVVDVTASTLTVEASGKPDKLEALRQLLDEFGIVELSRTGRIALSRGRAGDPRAVGAASGELVQNQTTGTGRDTEMATIYYEKDTDTGVLADQKIAILGYGSQGHAHALNLQDSGYDVRVGLRPGSASRVQAQAAGLRVLDTAEAVAEADIVMCLLPDTSHAKVYGEDIAPNLKDGDMLMFAHGFSIHFQTVVPPEGVDVTMIAPKGPGHLVRRTYEEGNGTPGLVAVQQDATGKALQRALAYGNGIGCARPGIIQTTFKEETETDLFGEQTVLCGGLSSLIKNGFETLVERRLPARDRVLRVPARGEADRGPDLRGRPVVDAPLGLDHRRVGRLRERPARRRRARPGPDGAGAVRDPGRDLRAQRGSPRPMPASRSTADFGTRRGRPSSRAWGASCAR